MESSPSIEVGAKSGLQWDVPSLHLWRVLKQSPSILAISLHLITFCKTPKKHLKLIVLVGLGLAFSAYFIGSGVAW